MRQYNVNNSQPEHKFWSTQEVISTSLVGDNTCGSTIIIENGCFISDPRLYTLTINI